MAMVANRSRKCAGRICTCYLSVLLLSVLFSASSVVAQPIPEVGDRVWAQWTPNAWFPGTVGRTMDVGLHIEFEDGDKADLPVSLVVPDRNPNATAVTVGSRVIARWHDNRYYPGTVTSIANQHYDIAFDDGDVRNRLTIDQIRMINE